jgi:hypothetical protein
MGAIIEARDLVKRFDGFTAVAGNSFPALPARGKLDLAREFAADSVLEESGCELLVPLATEMLIELARGITNATRMLAVGDIGPVPRPC